MPNCPQESCFRNRKGSKVVRIGSFYRTSDRRFLQRFLCKGCLHSFSQATGQPCFGQHKREVNEPLRILLSSGVSLRRAARILCVHRKTVARKLIFLGIEARKHLAWERKRWKDLSVCQFDELETFEHTKCKPISVVMGVLPETRKIVSFQLAQMPAKGHLARRARKKYGFRKDYRPYALTYFFSDLQRVLDEKSLFVSDSNPQYPLHVHQAFPQAEHRTVLGARGSSTGQGELKKLGFDPLFALNHTFAMCRANINRLFRKTWCTTKKTQNLAHHLAIYADFHNSVLTP